MAEEHKRKEERELIRKFEAFLKNRENHFFDEDALVQIINYYSVHDKLNQALKAANIALDQFPYSIDLTIEKSDVLVKMDQSSVAIDLLEETLNIQPNDPELLLQKGAIHCLLSEFEEAIEAYTSALINVDEKDEVYFSIGMAYQGLGKFMKPQNNISTRLNLTC